MNGVEILSEKVIYNCYVPAWLAFIAVILGALFLTITICCFVDRYDGVGFLFGALSCICIVIAIHGAVSNKNNVNHIEYKVTIDDSVSMNEFLDKYEILDQEGKIYTVKERE
jgi:hypothetical protein